MTVRTLDWGRAVALIEQAGTASISLACHVSPDGDALGSMLAFGLGLRQLGIDCAASFGDPFRVSPMLAFLPGQELLVPPSAFPAAPEVMVTFDAASLERLGTLGPYAKNARQLLVVDHHASNTGFGDVALVEPSAAATAVLTAELLDHLGVQLTPDIALCLYTGLASDTGSFRYPTTTPEVHALAGRLLDAGVRPDLVARELWDRVPFGYLKVLSAALAAAQLDRQAAGGAGVVWTVVTRSDRAAHELPYDLLEGVIDAVRRCEEADVAVVFKETDDGRWYVSTRSKGRVDVGRACVALGGGGHSRAAAFTTTGEPAAIMTALLPHLTTPMEAAS